MDQRPITPPPPSAQCITTERAAAASHARAEELELRLKSSLSELSLFEQELESSRGMSATLRANILATVECEAATRRLGECEIEREEAEHAAGIGAARARRETVRADAAEALAAAGAAAGDAGGRVLAMQKEVMRLKGLLERDAPALEEARVEKERLQVRLEEVGMFPRT